MIPGWRLLWLIVTFDLPVLTREDKRQYRRFVDFLEDDGFVRIQYSIFVRPTQTQENTEVHSQRIADHIPPVGQVRVFRFTDKQWARTECFHNARRGIPEKPPEQFVFFDEDLSPIIREELDSPVDAESAKLEIGGISGPHSQAVPALGIGRIVKKTNRRPKKNDKKDQFHLEF